MLRSLSARSLRPSVVTSQWALVTVSTQQILDTLRSLYDVFNAIGRQVGTKRGSNNGNRRRHRRRSLSTLPSQPSHQRMANLRHRLDRLRPRRNCQLFVSLPRSRSPQPHHRPTANSQPTQLAHVECGALPRGENERAQPRPPRVATTAPLEFFILSAMRRGGRRISTQAPAHSHGSNRFHIGL